MLDADAIEAIAALGEGRSPKILCPDAEPKDTYLLLNSDAYKKMQADPPKRKHKAYDLTAIIERAKEFHIAEFHVAADMATGLDNAPRVWYSRKGVVLVFFDNDRRDTATLELTYSPQMKTLMQFEKNITPMTQAEIVRLLKTTFKTAIGHELLLNPLKSVKFNSQGAIEGNVGLGVSSVGRAARQELDRTDTFKDWYSFAVPVFDGPLGSHKANVEVAFEVDPQNQKFWLTPLPLEIERAICAVETQVGYILRAELDEFPHPEKGNGPQSVPVYYGEP